MARNIRFKKGRGKIYIFPDDNLTLCFYSGGDIDIFHKANLMRLNSLDSPDFAAFTRRVPHTSGFRTAMIF